MNHFARRTLFLAGLFVTLAAFAPAPMEEGVTPLQQMYVMKEIKPNLERVGILINSSNNNEETMRAIRQASASLNVQIFLAEIGSLPDIAPKFRWLMQEHKVQMLWILEDESVLGSSHGRGFLIQNALKAGVPILAPSKVWVDEGACMTMTKDADGIKLIVNKTAADALSITVPDAYAQRTQFLAAE